MKRTLISLCVVVFFVACGTEPIEEISVNKRNSSFASWDSEELPPILDYASDSVELYNLVLEYVERNHAILGQNVMIFQTHNQMYQTIDLIQELNPDQLREWTIENNWTNEILESNILLDSVLYANYANCGIDFDNLEDEDSACIAVAIDAFDEAYEQRPDYFVIKTRDGDEFIEPLGSLDEAVFYNDKNIYIVEGLVNISYGERVVICPLDLFVKIGAIATDAVTMYLMLKSNATEEQEPFVVYKDYYKRNFTCRSSDNKYITDIDFRVDEFCWLICVEYYTRVNITNYVKNNSNQYVKHRMRTQLDLVVNAGGYTYDFIFEIHKDKKVRKRTWKDFALRWFYEDCQIRSYDLHLQVGNSLVYDASE